VHRALRRAAVLVLLSQPTPTWREQVGLPLVEGLAHGCTVVTTAETGLADWLAAHGHTVLAPDAAPATVVAAVVEALAAGRPAASVLADLPDDDGRQAAEAWLSRPAA
jgi:glycosyltransferase involved in cell wall biosynthesis